MPKARRPKRKRPKGTKISTLLLCVLLSIGFGITLLWYRLFSTTAKQQLPSKSKQIWVESDIPQTIPTTIKPTQFKSLPIQQAKVVTTKQTKQTKQKTKQKRIPPPPPPPPPLPPPPPQLPLAVKDEDIPIKTHSHWRKPPSSSDTISSTFQMSNPAIVILAHNRPNDLQKVLSSLYSLKNIKKYKVYISMDSPQYYNSLETMAKQFDSNIQFWHMSHTNKNMPALYKISDHFRFALKSGFETAQHSHLILLEDDLIVAQDFLSLFESTAWLLEKDFKTTWCVSAWNDNGLKTTTTTLTSTASSLRGDVNTVEKKKQHQTRVDDELIESPPLDSRNRLLRTGYFPGLGWMTTNRMWTEELSKMWPDKPSTGWDHYIRQQPATSRFRECIYPEIPRTKHISKKGTNVNSNDQVQKFAKYNFYDDVAAKDNLKLIENPFYPTSYLLTSNYKKFMHKIIKDAETVVVTSFGSNIHTQSKIYIYYYKRENFDSISRQIELPKTQPRGTHLGVLQTRVPRSTSILLLIDKRTYKYGDVSQKLTIPNGITMVGAHKGENCIEACARIEGGNKKCVQDAFEFLNTCEALKKIFKCENGCGHQIGAEIPCYVEDDHQPTNKQCLVTDGGGAIKCSPSHRSTKRLCGCK